MTLVKICGLTSVEDARAAQALGADALGFVLARSPRRIDPNRVRSIIDSLGPFTVKVGVFVNESEQEALRLMKYCGLDLLQFHGDESEERVKRLGKKAIKAMRVKDGMTIDPHGFPGATILLDTYVKGMNGGSGQVFNWELAREISKQRPVILAGGLTPENVNEAITKVLPYAVDVSSGVEAEPGRKDHAKLERFIRRAKGL